MAQLDEMMMQKMRKAMKLSEFRPQDNCPGPHNVWCQFCEQSHDFAGERSPLCNEWCEWFEDCLTT